MEQHQHLAAERASLEARVRQETFAKLTAGARGSASSLELSAEASRQQEVLAALLSCLRETSRAAATPQRADAVEGRLCEMLQRLRDLAEPLPAVQRLRPGEFLIAGETVRCELDADGGLLVQAAGERPRFA